MRGAPISHPDAIISYLIIDSARVQEKSGTDSSSCGRSQSLGQAPGLQAAAFRMVVSIGYLCKWVWPSFRGRAGSSTAIKVFRNNSLRSQASNGYLGLLWYIDRLSGTAKFIWQKNSPIYVKPFLQVARLG